MEIQIIEHMEDTLKVLIQCRKADDEVLRLKTHIELFANKFYAKKDNESCFINASEVLYFEAVDNRTFLYTQEAVLEIRQRLYELEDTLSEKDFIRISKSVIVNINQIRSLKPELNRTILATLCNGERLSISRKYVPAVRKLLSI
ncbi:MAG: LytTR family DNA-binding domain-containing protein [Lachnospiraceae bacterium]|nr:LytTR family DNA-binding domain-containing protein [Lachnospiraceae bacterium]